MVDGWILGPDSELLFWVPPELRKGFYRARNTAIIGRVLKTKLDLGWFVYGGQWSQCKDPLPQKSVRSE